MLKRKAQDRGEFLLYRAAWGYSWVKTLHASGDKPEKRSHTCSFWRLLGALEVMKSFNLGTWQWIIHLIKDVGNRENLPSYCVIITATKKPEVSSIWWKEHQLCGQKTYVWVRALALVRVWAWPRSLTSPHFNVLIYKTGFWGRSGKHMLVRVLHKHKLCSYYPWKHHAV